MALRTEYAEGFLLPEWEGETLCGHSPHSVFEESVSTPGLMERVRAWMVRCNQSWPGGMAVGLFGYGAGFAMDRVRLSGERASFPFPDVHLGWYTEVERVSGPVVSGGCPDGGSRPYQVRGLEHSITSVEYGAWVARTKEYIRAGDIFQANLAHPLQFEFCGDAHALFARSQAMSAAPWTGMYWTPQWSVLSNSPELLLRVRGSLVRSRPIAGTRPRGEDADGDARRRRDLLRSPKERAEHAMLVDLVRNDLGRSCQFGSVSVPELMLREPYRNVFHIVSEVQGHLRPGCDNLDALAGVFPGGTITGAPKLRSMEIIAELERYPRGFYTGSLGWCLPDGDAAWNILIRTVQIEGGANEEWRKAWLHVGAGIVADSDPLREYQETLAKAKAWLDVLDIRP